MLYRKITGIAAIILTTVFSAFGQTKIHDNLIVPPGHQKFEVEIRGAGWSVLPLTKIFDDRLDEIYSDEIIYSLNHALKNSALPVSIDPSEIEYTRDFDYKSTGYYYGIALRYYPSGLSSKFVWGLSIDKTSVTVKGKTDFTQNIIRTLKADGTGTINLKPILANLHLQYHFNTEKNLRPYLSFGLGAGFLDNTNSDINSFQFDLNTSFSLFGIDYSVPANFTYSLEEIEQRSGKSIPNVMPLVQLAYGAKYFINERFNVNMEVGIYNGFQAKLGSAFRF